MRGYAYDRRDVTGRGLANAYAQTLGTIFSSGGEKPYEVEIFVAEVGDVAADDQIYRLTYDGQVADEHGFAVMGGAADTVAGYLRSTYREGLSLDDALPLAVAALGHSDDRRDRVIPDERPRGRGPRPHPQPAPQVPADPARRRLSRILGDRGPADARAPVRRTGRRRAGPDAGTDDPADPTDQTSGGRTAAGGPADRRAAGRAATAR